MSIIDVLSTYLFVLKYVSIAIAFCIAISSIDDTLIDVIYWFRFAWRELFIYRKHGRLDYKALYKPDEKPFAILIPAWHETGVIESMAKLAVSTLDYENYHIFIGTYPNDPETQEDVDNVAGNFPNVHKVICARPGPTSKADCLNNIIDAILQFERRANLEFAGFILHDAEDVISRLELRLFNYLVADKDLIQVPVYPFERKWTDLTSMSYLDEFTEIHSKDILVREAIAGQVPSAGVGTCFSRRAVLALLADGEGLAFDTQSLTEDYDIGFRLKEKGLKEIFVRFPVVAITKAEWKKTRKFGQSIRDTNVICVREYFPNTLSTAVRQKSRWIIGIVFQGYVTQRWKKSVILNYFLWRDRKGAVTNFLSFLTTLILVQLLALSIYQLVWPDAYQFSGIFEQSEILINLLLLNLVFMINRIVQRCYFVTRYYGLFEGFMSIPRRLWCNLINFLANWRALSQILRHGNPHRVAWDKTTHDFPQLGEARRARRMLGQILIESGAIKQEQLDHALTHKARGMKLGAWLVHENVVTPVVLAQALGHQGGVPAESVDPYALDDALIKMVPTELALHYAVLPIRLRGETLILASESVIDPISLAALSRKLKRPVEYVIAHLGQVTVGVRRLYARNQGIDPKDILTDAVRGGRVTESQAKEIWSHYVSRQTLFAQVLLLLGGIDAAALSAVLLQHEKTTDRLGDYLVSKNIVSQQTLDEALEIQRNIQPYMSELIDQWSPSKLTNFDLQVVEADQPVSRSDKARFRKS